MTTVSAVRGAAVLPLILLATACAQQGGPTGPAAPRYPGDAVVLRIDHTGGFVSPEHLATRLPIVTVYGDGRVIMQGPTLLRHPAPALPNVQVVALSPAEVDRIVERAREAGVGTAGDLGRPSVTDVPATRFSLRGPTGVEETTVEALDVTGPAEAGLNAGQRAAREKLRTFAQSLSDATAVEGGAPAVVDPSAVPGGVSAVPGGSSATPDGAPAGRGGPAAAPGGVSAGGGGPAAAPGGASTAPPQPYRPTAVAAVAQPWVADAEAGRQPEVAWPGPALPGAPLSASTGLTCVTVTGEQVKPLLDAAATANVLTPWVSEGKRWRVTLRPLLPDETDCASLAGAR
ncbi:hypothetical protein [Micromonospora sp. KC723]|uniref:hypothetical protein n=1 Tax=Micromonospora sp. KC723 TaxID=2530381 RepID=UPI00104AD425|nr:hypothetical protein [Micromonospora sp. KC723]TDB78525.1 hypothetical protein E1165_00560 [Micromonospora sp. KC723]